MGNAQSQARSLSWFFRCEERVEDPVQQRLGDPATCIGDGDANGLALEACGECQASFPIHRLRGVDDQVDEQLIDFRATGQNGWHLSKMRHSLTMCVSVCV